MKFIIPILVFIIATPATLFAEETPTPPPTVMGIAKGQTTPYAGVLLNPTAAAQIFAERNYSLDECNLRINFEVEKCNAKYDALLKNTQGSLESLQKKYDSITVIKDKEIERLSEIASGKKVFKKTIVLYGFPAVSSSE